jgi:hypothetical protein
LELQVIEDFGDSFKVKISGCDVRLSKQFEGLEQVMPKTSETLKKWKGDFKDDFFKIGKQ